MNLTSLYQGALLSPTISKQLGTSEAAYTDARASLLTDALATGKLSPGSLSPQDSSLVGQKVSQSGGGGILNTLLGAVETPFKIIGNTAGDFVNLAEQTPAGLYTLGQAAANTGTDVMNAITGLSNQQTDTRNAGPNLGQVGKGIVTGTVGDFTHFDPMHPLMPILDIAALGTGGLTAAARGSAAISRLGAAGRLAEDTADVGRLAKTLGRTSTIQRLSTSEPIRAGVRLGSTVRPTLTLFPETQVEGLSLPTAQARYYSTSPFRKYVIEKPTDRLVMSNLGKAQIPGLPEGMTLSSLHSSYLTKKSFNVFRGRSSSGSISNTVDITRPLMDSIKALRRESGRSDSITNMKFDAAVLQQVLGVADKSPEERLAALDTYNERILAPHNTHFEGFGMNGTDAAAIRDFRYKLYNSDTYRRFFEGDPTPAMRGVVTAWREAVNDTQLRFASQLDPHEVLNRTLGPAAHVFDRTPDEMLREQPQEVQNSMNFAMQAHDIEQAIRGGDEGAPELQLVPKLAASLPGAASPADKAKLMEDAVESLKEDLAGKIPKTDLINNADKTGYLQGETLAQKVAAGLHDRFGINPQTAEMYATGGLTNYFPLSSYVPGSKVRYEGNFIQRRMESLRRGERQLGTQVIGEYRRSNPVSLMRSAQLGVASMDSFLREADLSAFKAGVDRRDPITLLRHVSQRERLLVHRQLGDPMVEKLLVRDGNGNPITVSSHQELIDIFGSAAAADKYTAMPVSALRILIHNEDTAAAQTADILDEVGKGELSAEQRTRMEQLSDEAAQGTVRDIANEAIKSKGKMVVLPRAFEENLVRHARILDSNRGVSRAWVGFINHWRSAVLAYMPSWLIRTSFGHGVVLFISGVGPKDYIRASKYFGHGFEMPNTAVRLARATTGRDLTGTRIMEGAGREVPYGIEQGAPQAEFGQVGEHRAMAMNTFAQMNTRGVHAIANFQRRAAFLHSLNKISKQHMAELEEAFQFPKGFKDARNIDKAINDHPEWVHQALNELDRVSYTFGQMGPYERRFVKFALPFYGWYKFITRFVWSLPFTYPGRSLAIARLGQIGNSDFDALGPMPEWLRNSIMFDTNNLAAAHYFSTQGLNPLGDVANPLGGVQGMIRLSQMSPVVQALASSAGYNTLTGGLETIDPSSGIAVINGRYVNIHTGQEYDSLGQASLGADLDRFFGSIARSFPEIRITEELATGGKPVYPESIPFIKERPIVSSTATKNITPLGILGQFSALGPRTYDIQKYQGYFWRDLARAQGIVGKAQALERGQ